MTDLTIPRDRWGRPTLPHPFPDGELLWHHRPSSIGKIVDDTYNLDQWQKRMVIVGACQRPDLLALADTLDPDDRNDKRQLNKLASEFQEAAKASKGANTGTALHSYTEQIDAGKDVTPLPMFVDDLEAYRKGLADHSIEIDPHWMERFVVWSDKRIAGSCDRYVMWNGRMVTFDLKTGASNPADFSLVSYAAQLASYANCTHAWDGVNAEALPEIDTELGLIGWLPAGKGHFEVIEVDLTEGARIVDLALDVYWTRKNKELGHTLPTPTEENSVPPSAGTGGVEREPGQEAAPPSVDASALASPLTQKVGELRRRLAHLTEATDCTVADVKAAWPEGAPPLTAERITDDELEVIEGMVMMLEMGYGVVEPDQPDADSMLARLKALPADLLALATTHAKALEPPVPNLQSGKATVADLDRLDRIVAPIEALAAERITHLVDHLNPMDEATADALILWATEGRDVPVRTASAKSLGLLDNLEAERLSALAELYADPPDDLTAYLVDRCGSKTEVVRRAKACAERHDITRPKSTADVAANRVLVALTTAKETEQ